jgi:transcriptional regulator of acetoin/glycerol metabolism
VALQAGAWHESQRGTNAIGTALAEACGIEIHGRALRRNGFLTCAASPSSRPPGELLGMLDISGRPTAATTRTPWAWSTAAARMIENRLFATTCRHGLCLHLHPQPHGTGTVAEGVLSPRRRTADHGANRQAP